MTIVALSDLIFHFFLFVILLSISNLNADSHQQPSDFSRKLKQSGGANALPGEERQYTHKSICFINGTIKFVDTDGVECGDKRVAHVAFKNAINLTGWSFLEVETDEWANPDLQAYAAGYLEGTLTSTILDYRITNSVTGYCKGFESYCERLNAYFKENLEYVREKIDKASPDNFYWQAVKRTYLQMSGIWDGYKNSKFSPRISYEIHPIFMLNSKGDLYDLEKKFNKTTQLIDEGDNGSCSGLIKLAPNNEDLFISQVTMSGFQNMLRILKLYKFGYDESLYPGRVTSFSSYPGMVYSSDDFALTGSGLAVIETTISVFNRSMFDDIKPRGQLLSWVRAVVANQLARNAREWCKVFARYNSGTYNNQWAVIDYKMFQPGAKIQSDFGLLYVLEQTPGYVKFRDLTTYLKKYSYFASYNIPYFKSVNRMTGFEEKAKNNSWLNWSDCPRAKIFRRDHTKVVDLDTLTTLMRYNDYKHEEYSRCDCEPFPYTAEAAISSRGDLNPANGTYPIPGMGHLNHGALDYKGTNYKLSKALQFRSISSPAYDNVPVFMWSTFDMAKNISHVGLPDIWNFDEIQHKWHLKF